MTLSTLMFTLYRSHRKSHAHLLYNETDIQGPFANFVYWRQCAAVMHREGVIVIPSCNGAGNVVVA